MQKCLPVMKILFIAPLPPPVNGQSLAAETFLKRVFENNKVVIVNLAKKRPKNILDRISRNFAVAKILIQTFNKKTNVDLIYLTISESFAGNVKDLFIYLICYRKLMNTFIHMLGVPVITTSNGFKGAEYENLEHNVNSILYEDHSNLSQILYPILNFHGSWGLMAIGFIPII